MQQFSHSWPASSPQQMHWLIYLSHHASFPHGSCLREGQTEAAIALAKRDSSVLHQNATRDICTYVVSPSRLPLPRQKTILGLALVSSCNCYCCRQLQFADTNLPLSLSPLPGLQCHPRTGDRNEMKFCQAEPQQHLKAAPQKKIVNFSCRTLEINIYGESSLYICIYVFYFASFNILQI